jgi:hypothetical protein
VPIFRIIAPVAAAAIYLGMAAGALAQDHAVVFAGGTYDSASYGDVGMQVALPGSVAGRGFAIRGSAFLGGYGYNDGFGQHVDATFGGGELDGVYAISGAWGSADLFAGVRDVDTRLSPADVGNRRRGDKAEFALGTDGDRIYGPWRTDWYGAYGTDLRDYQTRASLTHRFGPVWRLGAEGAVEGDPTYTLERVGPYAGFRLSAHSEIQGSVGVSHQSGLGEHAYARISWYRSF